MEIKTPGGGIRKNIAINLEARYGGFYCFLDLGIHRTNVTKPAMLLCKCKIRIDCHVAVLW